MDRDALDYETYQLSPLSSLKHSRRSTYQGNGISIDQVYTFLIQFFTQITLVCLIEPQLHLLSFRFLCQSYLRVVLSAHVLIFFANP